jgi:hypothetical protein
MEQSSQTLRTRRRPPSGLLSSSTSPSPATSTNIPKLFIASPVAHLSFSSAYNS